MKSFFIVFIILFCIKSSYAEIKWYVGGTLHRVTCSEWKAAAYADKLATAADLLVASEPWRSAAMKWGVDSIKDEAMSLEDFISSSCDAGTADGVQEFAAMGKVLMRH